MHIYLFDVMLKATFIGHTHNNCTVILIFRRRGYDNNDQVPPTHICQQTIQYTNITSFQHEPYTIRKNVKTSRERNEQPRTSTLCRKQESNT